MKAIVLFRRAGGKLKRSLFSLIEKSAIYPIATSLSFPIEGWQANGSKFLQKDTSLGEYWGEHLGEDYLAIPGAEVKSIGRGIVLYSAKHTTEKDPRKNKEEKQNWGNVIIIGHGKNGKKFLSIYGHLGERYVKRGDIIEKGQPIGTIGSDWSSDNGWWESHLHLGIFQGNWRFQVLPGYWLEKMPRYTRPKKWAAPTKFIQDYCH